MLLTVKLLVLSVLFVATGGSVFSAFGKRHRLLIMLAATVSLVGTAYFFHQVYYDIGNAIVAGTEYFMGSKPDIRNQIQPYELNGGVSVIKNEPNTSPEKVCVNFNDEEVCE